MELIYDRTEADTLRLLELKRKGWPGMTPEEKSEWAALQKGGYDFADYNRVESAMRTLADTFALYGYACDITTRTDWSAADIPTPGDMERYLANLRTLRAVQMLYAATPPVPPTMDRLTWQAANDIERILADIESMIEHMVASFHYSNQFYAGESIEICGFRFARRRTVAELEAYTVAELERYTVNEIEFGGVG